jgi:hypothetical protein
MRKLIICLIAFIATGVFLYSCKKDHNNSVSQQPIPADVLAKIKAQGFSTDNVLKVKGGYVVEGDIYLTDSNINHAGKSTNLVIAKTEQYRTTNIVTFLPRTIPLFVDPNLPQTYTAAIDAVITRYSAANLNLCLTFQRVANNGEINIVNANNLPANDPDFLQAGSGIWGRSGAPSNGNPWYQVGLNVAEIGQNPDQNFLTTVIAHEIGHCIGFRHTDYMDRSFSNCPGGGNEGDQGIGAIWIPGTPTGPDAASWMLACIGPTDNRPFNANDVTALRYLYSCQGALYMPSVDPCNGIYSTATIAGNQGDIIDLRLSFGGYVNWNGQSNGAGASIWLAVGSQNNSAASTHYYGSGGFGLNVDVVFTMQTNAAGINTTAVVNNSTTMFSSTATLTVVSVNGVTNNNQAVVCGGNSSGYW